MCRENILNHMLAPKLNFIFYKTNTTDFWESIFQLNLGCFKLVHETFCLNTLCRNIKITDQTKESQNLCTFTTEVWHVFPVNASLMSPQKSRQIVLVDLLSMLPILKVTFNNSLMLINVATTRDYMSNLHCRTPTIVQPHYVMYQECA